MTQEYHLSVTPLGADSYLVRTEQVARGVPLAEEQVVWPVSDWLNQARQLYLDPMLDWLQMPDHLLSSPEQGYATNLLSLGQQLYHALFQGTIRDSWLSAQVLAQDRGEKLRLRLGLKTSDRYLLGSTNSAPRRHRSRLARLPWEVLHDGSRPLATGTDLVFSRYHPVKISSLFNGSPSRTSYGHQTSAEPLRILMAIAAPSDRESLELEEEARNLQAEFQISSPGVELLELTILAQPDRQQLTQALEQGKYDVFHYAGHSNLGASGGEIYLVSGKTGLTERLSGEDLAGLLVNNGIRVAVFNSCRSASGDGDDRNLAETLVLRGIPGVLAMAERIPDRVALTLSQLLYRNLKQGYPIDLSLSRARQGLISAYGSHQLYWALPILYLQPGFDGCLTSSSTWNSLELLDIEPFSPWSQEVIPEASDGKMLGEFDRPTGSRPSPVLVKETPYSQDIFPQQDLPIPLDQPDLQAYNNLGLALIRQGRINDAIGVYQQALQTHPDFPDAHYNLGVAFYEQGRLDEAIASYLKAIESNPNFPDAYNNLGIAFYEFGQIDEAISAYQQALALDPHHSNAQSNLNLARETPQAVGEPRGNLDHQSQAHQGKSNFLNLAKFSIGSSFLRWLCLSMGVMSAFLLFGLFRWQSSPPLGELPPYLEPPPGNAEPDSANDNINITERAAQLFREGKILAGSTEVEKLLDSGVLNFAEQAIAAVPKDQINHPRISYLRGRLAWQEIGQGNSNYSLDDVRRFWEWSAKQQGDNPTYYNALGFAYYALGDLDSANKSWIEALELIAGAKANLEPTGQLCPVNQDSLTACAGLALVLLKYAQNQPPEQQASSIDRAIRLHQQVLRVDRRNFLPLALAKNNWLWTEMAIADWRSLLSLQ